MKPLLLASLLLAFSGALRAADSVESLRQRLNQLEAENAALKAENARLRQRLGEPPLVPRPVPPPVVAAPAASPPAEVQRLQEDNRKLREQLAQHQQAPAAPATVAPLEAGRVYSVDEFLGLFGGNFLGAETAYRGRKIRVRGVVEKFERPFVGSTYKVYLRGTTPVRMLQCRIRLPGSHNPALSADGRTLRGTKPFGADFVFMSAGDEITVEGEFEGMKDNVLVIENATHLK